MRLLRLAIALLICLVVAGCMGENGATTQTAHTPRTTKTLSIVATPTPTGPGVDELMKAAGSVSSPRPTPTRVRIDTGPLSCIEQRMRALQEGKVLPTDVCR